MRLAIEQGELVKGHSYPNPPVGAVILDRDGEAVGVGATEAATGGTPRWSRWAAPASWRSAACGPAWPICLDHQIASGRTASVHRDLLIGLRK